jgi:hypothetical protein
MGTMTYTFIAFPKGKRTVIATMHGMDRNYEAMVAVAAMRAGVSAGSEADAMVTRAASTSTWSATVRTWPRLARRA